MLTIKTLNAISPIYKEQPCAGDYTVSGDIANPDAIIVRSADMHNMELPASVRAIARAGAGFNNIPVMELGKRGVVVFNTPGANANAVRELAVAGMLLSARNIIGGIEWTKTIAGEGDQVPKLVEKGKGQFVGPELKGKTLGVMGLGEVGALVANAGRALDMQVLGFDPYISVDHAWMLSRAIGRVKSRDELIANSDFLSIHVPLMEDTRGMFNRETISKMKRGAVLLNFSRGELAVDEDILAALKEGQLGKYVTDFPSAKLIGQEGVIAIPHLGASTPESEDNCVVMAFNQIDAFLKTGTIKNSVNYPNCELEAHDGARLTILHANVPNVVSHITALVAQKGINIAGMVNKSRGEYAYSVLDLDGIPAPEIIGEVEKLDTVFGARAIW